MVGSWVNCAWIEVSGGRFVGGCIITEAPYFHIYLFLTVCDNSAMNSLEIFLLNFQMPYSIWVVIVKAEIQTKPNNYL